MNLEATLSFYHSFFGGLEDQLYALKQKALAEHKRAELAAVKVADCGLAVEFYKRGVDVVYEASVGELEKVTNLALEFIFSDRDFKAVFTTSSARGVKTLNIVLRDEAFDPPLDIDMKEGIGAGVRTVVSVVLHLFYLINKGAYPALFVDEGYSCLSEDYIERFFTFLKGICEKKGFHIILISHDPRMLDYADKKYRVKDGVVEEVTNLGTFRISPENTP